jgi:hypothetical protein
MKTFQKILNLLLNYKITIISLFFIILLFRNYYEISILLIGVLSMYLLISSFYNNIIYDKLLEKNEILDIIDDLKSWHYNYNDIKKRAYFNSLVNPNNSNEENCFQSEQSYKNKEKEINDDLMFYSQLISKIGDIHFLCT